MQHHIIRTLSDLQSSDRQKQTEAAHYIRTKVDYADLEEIFRHLANQSSPALSSLIGVAFATSWAEVWSANTFSTIKSTKRSVSWLSALCQHHSVQIQKHVEYRDIVESAVIRGEWEEARKGLAVHQRTLGPTMWALRWTICLADESGGPKEKQELLKLLSRQNVGGNIAYFAHVFSIAVDKSLPDEHFRKAVRDAISSDSSSLCRFLELLFIEDLSGKWKTSDLLSVFEHIPLIDRYDLFIRLVAIAIATGQEDSMVLIRAVFRIGRLINDPQIKFLEDCIGSTQSLQYGGETESLQVAWDAYLKSDYRACLNHAAAMIQRAPTLLPAYELHAKATLYLGEREVAANKPSQLILHHLHNIFSKNDLAEDSLNFLNRLASRLRIFSITSPLRALYAQHSSSSADESIHRIAGHAMGVHSSRNFEYGTRPIVNRIYLRRAVASFGKGVAFKFFFSLAKGENVSEDPAFQAIPPVRKCFFQGLALARLNEHIKAAACLQKFITLQEVDANNPLSPFAIEEARRVLVNTFRVTGETTQMQEVIVQSILLRPQSVRRLPIRQAYETCLENRGQASEHIGFPIIAYFASDDPHEVAMALKRFLRKNGADIPSELFSSESQLQRRLAFLFLRVCASEVLDSLQDLNTVEKVQAERLKLLAWVGGNAPDFARSAETEILRVSQYAQLREAMKRIEGARVVLNPIALREAESERFSDAFYRYTVQKQLTDASTKSQIMSAIGSARSAGARFAIVATDPLLKAKKDTFDTFISAFKQIRDGFLSSPHFGLEACLSGRIRHGFLTQHIRKPFVERRLAVKAGSFEQKHIEDYWTTRLGGLATSVGVQEVMAILYTLTEKVDKTAEEVREIWIQSKTESRNPDGLFDYAFSDVELNQIQEDGLQDAQNIETFLDSIFEALIERTKHNLKIVRKHIQVELRTRLANIVDEALASIGQKWFAGQVSDLRNDLIECRQETEKGCAQLERWFQISDATLMGDQPFDLLARTAVGMIEILNPSFKNKHEISVNAVYQVAGRRVQALLHIIFFLLDNAIRHSGVSLAAFASQLEISATGNALSITVTNRVSSEEAAGAAALTIKSKIAQLHDSLDAAKVITEGGSGFAKIIAAVRYEFKQSDPIIEAKADGSRLIVSFNCLMEGIAA